MKTNTNSKYLIAVLIDGDNASFERMEDIMGFVSKVNLAAHFKETLQQHRFRRRFEPSAVHSEEIRSVH